MLDYFLLAAKEENQKERVCAEYLRRYNDGLILSNTIRMCDALRCLKKFHEEQMKKKTSVDDEQHIQITATERFLFNLFKGDDFKLFGSHTFNCKLCVSQYYCEGGGLRS